MDEPTGTNWRPHDGQTAADRAWQWCITRTVRDLRVSIRRGRPITRPNLERLFCRRWHTVDRARGPAHARRITDGRAAVRRTYRGLFDNA